MNILDLTCVQSEAELRTLFTNVGLKVSSEVNLTIIKVTDETNLEAVAKLETEKRHPCSPVCDASYDASCELKSFQLKGLIYDRCTGFVVAPGVLIPSNTEQFEDLESLEAEVDHITPAQDGVMFRLYSSGGVWHVSTNGMITPNRGWGPRGCRSFLELFSDLAFDTSALRSGLCYYVVMEHSEQTNVVKHEQNSLTLTRIVDVATLQDLSHTQLVAEAQSVGQGLKVLPLNTATFAEALLSHNTKCQPAPVKSDEVGYIIHLKDGQVFRLESWKYMHASSLKPNVADPRHQWVQIAALASQDDTIALAAERVRMHIAYFPWSAECFTKMSELLVKLVSTLHEDYNRIYAGGFKSVNLDSRHVKFQHELEQAFPESLTVQELEHFILQQAPARIYFLMNPDNIVNDYHSSSGSAGNVSVAPLLAVLPL